jgi:Fur family transcriptional regulator, peroxide stress response regulator
MFLDSSKAKLKMSGLKITPQRLTVLDSITLMNNHPTAEEIINFVRKMQPNIAVGTVYSILEILVMKDLIKKVKTETGVFRYDGVVEHHHHLYCQESDRIADYIDQDLDDILKEYFSKKKPANFKIEEIKLQINGKFLNDEGN